MIRHPARVLHYTPTLAVACLLSLPLATASHAAESSVAPMSSETASHTRSTVLIFNTQGEAGAMPNQLAIHFSARVQNTSPVTAQQRLNQMVKTAMDTAEREKDVSLHAGNYTLSQEYTQRGPQRWSAEQSLTLQGSDSAHLLALAEQLQSQGLGLNDMDWSIDPQTRQKLEDQARLDALKKIRVQAESDAQALGMKLARIERVQIGFGPPPEEPIAPRMMLMASARSAAPPQSTPEEQKIHVTVSARVILEP
ncbi:DUF541 domain-containing protein [Saccharibacter sp. 17.LH.SD]|uniref:SIMPL domain-containing protein n=1 Tax=Saccharibacter sp. 17.LH.SD TaxID=2689393 RepID=UPI00136F64B7|nr:SIMPL domain-containing protein [Saccharibacter sp. 17.LH.SD]MXV44971.1 DUF541 domain-containing protein [Saccharibacter sp. 17.LH.SD]